MWTKLPTLRKLLYKNKKTNRVQTIARRGDLVTIYCRSTLTRIESLLCIKLFYVHIPVIPTYTNYAEIVFCRHFRFLKR